MIEVSPQCRTSRKKGHPILGAQGISLGRDDFSAEIYKMSKKRWPGENWGKVRSDRARHQ